MISLSTPSRLGKIIKIKNVYNKYKNYYNINFLKLIENFEHINCKQGNIILMAEAIINSRSDASIEKKYKDNF